MILFRIWRCHIKKNVEIILLAVGLCVVFSKAMFTTYRNETVMTSDGNLYLLQYGSYINKDVMEENVKRIEDYLVYEEDSKYYVYVGAYTDLMLSQEMQKVFENEGIYTYLKNDYYGNSDILNKISILEKNLYEKESMGDKLKINKEILEILKRTQK